MRDRRWRCSQRRHRSFAIHRKHLDIEWKRHDVGHQALAGNRPLYRHEDRHECFDPLVTGLFTDTKIDTSVSTASADVGIQVCVQVDGSSAGILPAPCVIYDQRFQQISSQLFSQLSACQLVTSTTCTTTADCPTGDTCNNPTGGTLTGVCTAPNPLCNFQLILSTLSAHSFDFVAPVGIGKPHLVTTSWSTVGAGTVGNSHVATCVGPGIVSVTQVKVFNNSGSLSF